MDAGAEGVLELAIVGPSRFGIAEPYAGGLEAHTATLARGLAELGHRVTVYAGGPNDPKPHDIAVIPVVDEPLTVGRDERVDITTPARWAAIERRGYTNCLAQVTAGGYDIVHNTSLHYLVPTLEAELGVAMVHALHTPPFEWLHRAHHARTRPAGAIVTAVSEALAHSWGGIVTNVVGNGIDIARWHPEPTDQRQGAVWAGRIVPEKGPHLAIEAARLAGLHITLAGPIQDPTYFRSEIEPRLGADATYLGHLDTCGLRSLYSSGEVGVVTPCWEEPFGLVAAEMLACGTPVAGFDRGGLSSVVEPAVGELIGSEDPADLAAAIRHATGLDARTCRKHAVTVLSARTMAQNYTSLYRQRLSHA